MDDDARGRLAHLLREHALVRESVMLSSGRRSSYYFDARQVLLDPEGAALAGRLMWDHLALAGPAAVGGLTRDRWPLGFESQIAHSPANASDHALIFVRFDAAGGIDNHTARSHAFRSLK